MPMYWPDEDHIAVRLQLAAYVHFPQHSTQCVSSKVRLTLQNLGWYDPLRKETNLNAPAIKKWLSVGAQPSDTVRALLKKAMVID
jgi:small subunit ribosomal protein S16